jgi:hypothetical protein
LDFKTFLYEGESRTGALIWGPQFEVQLAASVPSPFKKTGKVPYYGCRSVCNLSDEKTEELLLEPKSTNFILHSESFLPQTHASHGWLEKDVERISSSTLSPSGHDVCLRILAQNDNAELIYKLNELNNRLMTLSVWLRSVEEYCNMKYTLDGGRTWVNFEINNSWQRYTFPSFCALEYVGFQLQRRNQAVEIWGCQLEDGLFATSYVPTTDSFRTRSPDIVYSPECGQTVQYTYRYLEDHDRLVTCVTKSAFSPDKPIFLRSVEILG